MAGSQNLEPNFDLFAGGDEQTFSTVFKQFYKPLCFFAHGILNNAEESEDIVSEVMSKLWQRCDQFSTLLSVKAFLYISTKNACLDVLKKRKYHAKVHTELSAKQDDLDAFLTSRILKVELIEYIVQFMKSLPEQQKRVFQLYYFFEQSIEEIAQQMSLTSSTVRWHKHEAVKKLRGILEKEDNLVVLLFWVTLLSLS